MDLSPIGSEIRALKVQQQQILLGQQQVMALLRDLLVKQGELLKRTDDRPASMPGVAPADQKTLSVILPAIWTALQGSTFTVAGLADVDDAGLKVALKSTGQNHRQLGKLLARCADEEVNFYIVRKSGDERAGCRWWVESVFETREKPANPL